MPGALLLSVPDATAGFRSPQANWGYITLDEGADPAAVQRQVAALLADNPEVGVRSQADFLAQLTSQVNTSGVLVGTALGTAVARALRDQFIPALSLPWGSMLVFLVLAVIVGLAAAILPAVRAARTDVLRAIAYE